MSALGILESSSDTIFNMMKDLGIDNNVQKLIVKKIMNIALRLTYCVLFRRSKMRRSPDLLNVSEFYCTCFLFLNILISQISLHFILVFYSIQFQLNYVIYADKPIIHCLSFSEAYNCNPKLLLNKTKFALLLVLLWI